MIRDMHSETGLALFQREGMFAQEFFEACRVPSCILNRPGDFSFGLRPVMPKLLLVEHHLKQLILRRWGQERPVNVLRYLDALDIFACCGADDCSLFLHRV